MYFYVLHLELAIDDPVLIEGAYRVRYLIEIRYGERDTGELRKLNNNIDSFN